MASLQKLYHRQGAGRPPRVRWTLEEVDSKLETMMMRAYRKVSDFSRDHRVPARVAAYAVALKSLSDCYAYSDSMSDLPMLSVVGHPTAVNPDIRLRGTALQHDWPILDLR